MIKILNIYKYKNICNNNWSKNKASATNIFKSASFVDNYNCQRFPFIISVYILIY